MAVLKPQDHFNGAGNPYRTHMTNTVDTDLGIRPEDHFLESKDDPKAMKKYIERPDGTKIPIFAGSATPVNPLDDKETQTAIDFGTYAAYDEDRLYKETHDRYIQSPISPLEPFTRLDPKIARKANLLVYNRTLTPIADSAYRKGYRHIFFNRPECYIMAHPNTGVKPELSQQASYDEDFSSAYSRMPHILRLLSPFYVSGSFSLNNLASNWNYLLSNNVVSMSGTLQTTSNAADTITAGVEGYTVAMGGIIESEKGGTLTIRFRETKDLEVYEFLRLWMKYIHKIKRGTFYPSYNGYQVQNDFIRPAEAGSPVPTNCRYHEYDRALDYATSIFDFYTAENDAKILHWCKYYGVYPTDVSVEGLKNDNGGILISPSNGLYVDATFKFQRKLENSNTTLVEFNFNSGLTDEQGKVNTAGVTVSYPYLHRDNPDHLVMKNYIGAAGMFTGSPFIIMGKCQLDPLGDESMVVPFLQFTALEDGELNSALNMGITNTEDVTNENIVGSVDWVDDLLSARQAATAGMDLKDPRNVDGTTVVIA